MLLRIVLICVTVSGMFICLCHSVTDREVREAVCSGATSLSDVSEKLGVGKCCGACFRATQEVIEQTLRPAVVGEKGTDSYSSQS